MYSSPPPISDLRTPYSFNIIQLSFILMRFLSFYTPIGTLYATITAKFF